MPQTTVNLRPPEVQYSMTSRLPFDITVTYKVNSVARDLSSYTGRAIIRDKNTNALVANYTSTDFASDTGVDMTNANVGQVRLVFPNTLLEDQKIYLCNLWVEIDTSDVVELLDISIITNTRIEAS